MWFEVFSSGEHTDSSGIKKNYTEADLDKIAYDYNSLIESDKSYQAPAVKGHPKNDDPAVGWVNKLARRGDKLVADIELISSDFAEDLHT